MAMSDAGKGDDYRPLNVYVYNERINSIFGRKCPKCNNFMSKMNNKIMCDNEKCTYEEPIQ